MKNKFACSLSLIATILLIGGCTTVAPAPVEKPEPEPVATLPADPVKEEPDVPEEPEVPEEPDEPELSGTSKITDETDNFSFDPNAINIVEGKDFVEGEDSIFNHISSDRYDGSEKWFFCDVDMDLDGNSELFILVSTDEPIYSEQRLSGDLWFMDSDGNAVRIETEDYYEYSMCAYTFEFEDGAQVIINMLVSATNEGGYIFSYKNGKLQFNMEPYGAKYFTPTGTLVAFHEDYLGCRSITSDGIEMWTGHTWMPYFYKYNNVGWEEYNLEQITQAQAEENARLDLDFLSENEEIIRIYRPVEECRLIIVTKTVEELDGFTDECYTTYFLDVALDFWAVTGIYNGLYIRDEEFY